MNGERKIKVVIMISNVDKAIGFEWLVEHIDQSRFELLFILFNEKPSHLASFLNEAGIRFEELGFSGKSDVPLLILKTIRILRAWKPDVVHTHLFGANLIGQTAARLTGVRKRIYTRHSSNENRRYHGKQRFDHYVNRMSTHIIAISKNVRDVLEREEHVPREKIRLLHHGFDLRRFENVPDADVHALSEKYNPDARRPVIGVIARYSHWKGIQFVIPAFQRLLDSYPDALLILANAKRGDYKDEIAALLSGLPATSFREIEFEHDLFALYQMFDVYVHTPIDAELEAFGQTYVEALAAGIPSVFTLSGVAPEFIEHEQNALVVNFQNSDEICESVKRLLSDEQLRIRLVSRGRQDVCEMFGIDDMVRRLEEIYAE